MEKNFFAGRGERKRISSIQFCSDSTLPGPGHPVPPTGSARRQDPVALVAPWELLVLWKCWRQVDMVVQQHLWGLALLPLDPWGSWPVMAERNPRTGLEVTEVLDGFGVSWVSRCHLRPPALPRTLSHPFPTSIHFTPHSSK